jgi:hypothetical protein
MDVGWISERWGSFSAAAGVRRYVIGGIVSIIIAVSDHLWPSLGFSVSSVLGLPSWALGVIIALLLISYWLLEHVTELRLRMKGARLELAKLRATGVALRNEGMWIADREVLRRWERRVEKWNKDVIKNIAKINEADAEWFSILDVVPPGRLSIERTLNNDLQRSAHHNKLYREHDFRLRRLGQMIYRLWER